MFVMSKKEHRALNDALASVRMEGFPITKETEADCLRLLHGEITVDNLVREIMARPV